jgi:photosystem II stability/assembly factor-like uncharacterized protein
LREDHKLRSGAAPNPAGATAVLLQQHTASIERGDVHPTSIQRGVLRTAIIVAATAILILTLAVPAFAASGWKKPASGTTAGLGGVAARGGLRWAVGAGGVIVASSDGGATWTARTSGTAQDLHAVAFADATHGWAVGAGGTILATTDGGATWAPQTSGTGSDLTGVAFADATHG